MYVMNKTSKVADLHVLRLLNIWLLNGRDICDWPANNQWSLHWKLNPTWYGHKNPRRRRIQSKSSWNQCQLQLERILVHRRSSVWKQIQDALESLVGTDSNLTWNQRQHILEAHNVNLEEQTQPDYAYVNLTWNQLQPDLEADPTWLGINPNLTWTWCKSILDTIQVNNVAVVAVAVIIIIIMRVGICSLDMFTLLFDTIFNSKMTMLYNRTLSLCVTTIFEMYVSINIKN